MFDVMTVALMTRLVMQSSVHFIHTFFYHLHPEYRLKIVYGYTNMIFPTFTILLFTYFLFSFYWGEGKTIGCLLLNLVTVNSEQRSLSFKEAFVRSFFHSFYFFSAVTLLTVPLLLIPFLRKDKKGLSDILSGTICLPIEMLSNTLPVLATEVANVTQEPEQSNVIHLPYKDDDIDKAA